MARRSQLCGRSAPALALKLDLAKRADLKPAMDEIERVLGPSISSSTTRPSRS